MNSDEALTQRLMQSMYHITRCRHATFKEILAKYGVTLQQFHLLAFILGEGKGEGKVKVTDISGKMLVSVPTASRMIDTLCGMGMIVKKKGAEDRRPTYLELTPKGRRIVREIRKRQLDIVSDILSELPEKDVETFLGVTERIATDWVAMLKQGDPEKTNP